ncbi:tRNA uridine 5-carboxymethylaminomethyl modification enzyme MnmG (Glucose-inhibited division protein A), partial [Durusdinium trenchii]
MLKGRGVKLPIIMISGHGDVPMAVQALKRGAIDFLEKPFRDQELLEQISRAIEVDEERRSRAASVAGIRGRLEKLTPREREVMELVVDGYANKQVAAKLGLSEKTIEVHRSRVMSKMRAKTLPCLVKMAVAVGVAEATDCAEQDTNTSASHEYRVIVIGGGHAGAEAAWAAANLLGEDRSVALVTLRIDTIGAMSCNPAIGGLAKGQLVNEIDAMGGLMGLAADATGINFALLNRSRGPAVRGPRTQSDKLAYPRAVRSMLEARPEIEIIEAAVEQFVLEGDRVVGVRLGPGTGESRAFPVELRAAAVILTTGTF